MIPVDVHERWMAANDQLIACPTCKAFAGLAKVGSELLPLDEWSTIHGGLTRAENRHRDAVHPDWFTCFTLISEAVPGWPNTPYEVQKENAA